MLDSSIVFTVICLVILAYLCGSIPFGYIAGKLKGIDLREHGSGNIGATNAVRVLGKKIGIPVFFCDFLKGLIPVCVAKIVLSENSSLVALGSLTYVYTLLVIIAVFAVLGHTYTCWLHFKGGKGVATAAGVLVALTPEPAGFVFLVWILVFLGSRYVSLASICGALSYPIFVLCQFGYVSCLNRGEMLSCNKENLPLVVFSFVVALLVVLKHISNMKRLLAGTESRAFTKKK